jgi:hypothetical protein
MEHLNWRSDEHTCSDQAFLDCEPKVQRGKWDQCPINENCADVIVDDNSPAIIRINKWFPAYTSCTFKIVNKRHDAWIKQLFPETNVNFKTLYFVPHTTNYDTYINTW